LKGINLYAKKRNQSIPDFNRLSLIAFFSLLLPNLASSLTNNITGNWSWRTGPTQPEFGDEKLKHTTSTQPLAATHGFLHNIVQPLRLQYLACWESGWWNERSVNYEALMKAESLLGSEPVTGVCRVCIGNEM
jgi:hypothetical protein